MAKEVPDPEDQRFIVGDPRALPYATNIDRRLCKREVPLRVIALGLPRTGTSCESAYPLWTLRLCLISFSAASGPNRLGLQ